MPDEVRMHNRSSVRKGAVAAFFQPDESESFMLGEIVDISEGGLGICYVDVEDRYNESLQVSVYGLDDKAFLERIPCKIVYDLEMPVDPTAILSTRRCGINFEGISKDLLEQLKRFLGAATS